MNYIGIDNGISGTVGVLDDHGKVVFFKTPVIKSKHFTKSRDLLTRIDRKKLRELLAEHRPALALIEGPFTNPGMFQATLSNHRSHAELGTVLEDLDIEFETVLPKTWQSVLLPGVSGREWLKEESKKKALELFPELKMRAPDADGLLIAVYLKQICEQKSEPKQKSSPTEPKSRARSKRTKTEKSSPPISESNSESPDGTV